MTDQLPAAWSADSEWSEEHLKLLYLVSKYSHCAQSAEEKERWIRKIPLLVLIYEAIVAGVLDYDYAPASENIGTRRIYINISQEGRDDVDDLREAGMINGLKLSSKEYQSVTAYQISPQGLELLKSVPAELRKAIDDLVMVEGQQIEAVWDGESFLLTTAKGYRRVSTITDCEDVSYVSSPYLPASLLAPSSKLSSSADRAHESAAGATNIRDELSEVITLSEVSVMIGEWIPFGANQIVALNDKLGATERVQGGLFTALVDEEPTGTQFEVTPGLTSVRILDYDLTKHLNFEAEVYYPEDEGIVQIENFGVHMRDSGSIVYGLKVEAILDRKSDSVSLDHLARLLVDVQQDSSTITDSLVSTYQRSLLEMTFLGDAANRDKFNLILADAISPKMEASRYMDKEDHENELKQVLGDTREAHDIGKNLLVLGRQGILLAGADAKRYEPLLLAYLSMMSMDIFVRNFFNRTFVLDDALKKIRAMIQEYEKDPNSISRIRTQLSQASKDVILLQETLGYLEESLELLVVPARPADPAGSKLHDLLRVGPGNDDLRRRVRDLRKNVEGSRHELDGLREMTDVISETQMFRLQEEMQANSKNLESVFRSNERASSSLEVLQVILSGTLAFEVLDRITGEWSVVETWWGKKWIVDPIINKPFVWFGMNLLLWGVIAFALIRFMRYLTSRSAGVLTVRFTANSKVDMKALELYLSQKHLEEEDVDTDAKMQTRKISWQESDVERWAGAPPKVEILYDEKHAFLLKVFMQVDKNGPHLDKEKLRARFLDELKSARVITA